MLFLCLEFTYFVQIVQIEWEVGMEGEQMLQQYYSLEIMTLVGYIYTTSGQTVNCYLLIKSHKARK